MQYEYESAFFIRKPELIINKLAILHKHKCLLNVSLGDNGDSFITTIFELNRKNNNVIFYHAPQKKLIEKLYDSVDLTFNTEHQGIKVSFNGNNMTQIRHNGTSAFTMPIPEGLCWIEARDFPRVKIPLLNPAFCLLMLNSPEPVKLKLYDISLTGFSVLNDSEEISEIIVPSIHFRHCKLLLPSFHEETVSFEVRHKSIIKQDLKSIDKIGCMFTQITQAFENTIQGYMMQIEREHRQNI